MQKKEELFFKDLEKAAALDCIKWEQLKEKRILITGATGIIGYSLVNLLLCSDEIYKLNIAVVVFSRNKAKAKELFTQFEQHYGKAIEYVEGDIRELPTDIQADYIVHGAAVTSSKAFIDMPVETITTSVDGTRRVLELGRNQKTQKVIFLSTMEVYGYPSKGHRVTEEEIGAFSPSNIRNSYPISKQLCEMLCLSYDKEYGVPVDVLRLTQTFGPGLKDTDNRFFAYLANCARDKKNIVLKTEGKTERSYLYSVDAASAILCVLTSRNHGEIYNVSNEKLYCSISDFAEKISDKYGIKTEYDLGANAGTSGFADTLYMNLDVNKLESQGWKSSELTIQDIFDRMV